MLNFIISHNLIAQHVACPKCGAILNLDWRNHRFRCQRAHFDDERRNEAQCDIEGEPLLMKRPKKYQFKQSCFAGTYFSRAKVPIDKILVLTVAWLRHKSALYNFIVEELGLSHKTISDWISFSREVVIDWWFENSEQIGGVGEVVEIDEAKLGKRYSNKGRQIKNGQWILGGVLRSNRRKVFIEAVEKRTAKVMIPIIRKWVAPGTLIITDMWRSYNRLNQFKYKHKSVNHSLTFVDRSDPRVHTQIVERMWREVRNGIPRFGARKKYLFDYLAEFTFKRAYPNISERIHQFFLSAAHLYKPKNQVKVKVKKPQAQEPNQARDLVIRFQLIKER